MNFLKFLRFFGLVMNKTYMKKDYLENKFNYVYTDASPQSNPKKYQMIDQYFGSTFEYESFHNSRLKIITNQKNINEEKIN